MIIMDGIFVIIKIRMMTRTQDNLKKMISHKKFCPCGKVFHQETDDEADFDEIWSGGKKTG